MKYSIALLTLTLLLSCAQERQPGPARLIDYVDPFIGTAGKGKTYPGATVPFGRIQLSPDNGRNGWDWISGYFYPDSIIAGFSHLHLTGTGAGDLYDISFLPTSGSLKTAVLDSVNPVSTVCSAFSHDNEWASPGYYQVYLEDYKVNVELTATERAGLQRYTFEGDDNQVRLHLGYTRNWDYVTDSFLEFLNDSTIVGYRHSDGWARDQKVFFVSVFSAPIRDYQLFDHNEARPQRKVNGTDILAICDMGDAREVMIKTAISSIGIEQAMQNLRTEHNHFDFEKVKQAAEHTWEAQLRKVNVQATEDVKRQFYTAMYHSMLAPTLFSDVDGGYIGPDKQIHQADNFKKYSTFSLWDTYRAQHPWLTITRPDLVPDLIQSMLTFYQESGQLPVWNMMGSETNMMIGYHAVPVLADAVFKGFPVDTTLIFEAMKASAMQDGFGIKELRELGYVPYEHGSWSVSKTMEYAYDDWCIAQVAHILGKTEDREYFTNRSRYYRNHFDTQTGYFRPRSAEGAFKKGFDPLAYHPEDFCEANALQYYWYVPHDVQDLIELSGGASPFEDKLDQVFAMDQTVEEMPAWISGYIGQYVHGNEPSHHIPYLYQYINKPGKTQRLVRQIMRDLYSTTPDGLAGNEDCGQMSAWYLFSALGFYPVNPADGKYILGSPVVESATIRLDDGVIFEIKVINQSDQNIYVKSVTYNGRPLDQFFIRHDQIKKGGKLVFEMTDKN